MFLKQVFESKETIKTKFRITTTTSSLIALYFIYQRQKIQSTTYKFLYLGCQIFKLQGAISQFLFCAKTVRSKSITSLTQYQKKKKTTDLHLTPQKTKHKGAMRKLCFLLI